jgi:hypothetical protein
VRKKERWSNNKNININEISKTLIDFLCEQRHENRMNKKKKKNVSEESACFLCHTLYPVHEDYGKETNQKEKNNTNSTIRTTAKRQLQ